MRILIAATMKGAVNYHRLFSPHIMLKSAYPETEILTTVNQKSILNADLSKVDIIIFRNSGYNIFAVVISIVGSVALTYLLVKLGRRKNHSISIYSLQLGKKGFSLVIVYIVLLYLITFFILLPEKLPTSAIPYLTIIGFYVFINWVFNIK